MIFLASSTSSIIQNAMKNHTKTTVDEVTKSNAYMIKIDQSVFTDHTLAHPLNCRGGVVARLSA